MTAALREACASAVRAFDVAADDKALAQLLYVAIYACGHRDAAAIDACVARDHVAMDSAFCRDLMRAVPDVCTEGGWTVTACAGERVHLVRDDVRAFVARSSLASAPEPGAVPGISVPAVRPGLVPGFVVRSCPDRVGFDALSRLYLNLPPDAAAWALGALSRTVAAEGVRHDLKVLAHPAAYDRTDSCVLYSTSDDAPRLIEVVARELRRARVGLRPRTPLLTWRMAPGAAFADDPFDAEPGRSHGQWVSGLLLAAAAETRVPDEMVAHVFAAIRRCGRDPARPFLRGDRKDAWPDLVASAAAFACGVRGAADSGPPAGNGAQACPREGDA